MKVSDLKAGDRLKGLGWKFIRLDSDGTSVWDDTMRPCQWLTLRDAQILLKTFGIKPREPEKVEFEARVFSHRQLGCGVGYVQGGPLTDHIGKRVKVTVEVAE